MPDLFPYLPLAKLPDWLIWANNIIWNTLTATTAGLISRLPFILLALVVLGATYFVEKLTRRATGKLFSSKRHRHSLKELMQRFATLLTWTVGIFIAALIIFPGLNIGAALGAAGLVSVAVGLAFKDIFENFFAGILLLWRFPFENGDFIECEGIKGKVVDTQLRMTLVRIPSGELTVIPNAMLITNPVEILTHEKFRRVSLMVGVAYSVDLPAAIAVIEAALKTCGKIHQDRPIGVYPTGFGDSSMDMEVLFWTGSTPMEMRQAKAEAVIAIKKALDDNQMEIPFPYRTLTFNEALEVKTEILKS